MKTAKNVPATCINNVLESSLKNTLHCIELKSISFNIQLI